MMGLLMVTTPLAGCLDEAEPLPIDDETNCEALICQCYEEYCDRDNNTTSEDNSTNNSSEPGNNTTFEPPQNNTIGDCDAETCECDSRYCDENNNTTHSDGDNMTEEERCLLQGNEWHTWLDENNTTVGACAVICFPEPPEPHPDDGNNTNNSSNETDIVCTTDLCWDGSSRDPADCSCPPIVNNTNNTTTIIDNYTHTWNNDLFLLTNDNNSYTLHINESLNWSSYVVHWLEYPEYRVPTSFYHINITMWPDHAHRYEENLTINMTRWWAEGWYHAEVIFTNCVPANGSYDCWETARGNFSLILMLDTQN
jgi:hypothetical protein